MAKFGDRAKFLVSNEYNPTFPEKPLEGSSYLRGIRIQEAKALLGERSYNYAAVEALIGDYIQEIEEIKTLLDASKAWNVARFEKFLECLEHHPKFASEVAERTRDENWWWIGYEEAYLAVIREKQDNIVEAFFHSFRAFEYIFAAWGEQRFGQYFETIKGVPYLNPSILDDSENYFSNKRCKDVNDFKKLKIQLEDLKKIPPEEVKNDDRVKLDMATICKMFRGFRYKEYKQWCEALKIFWDTSEEGINVSNRRNFIVHQVQGMAESDLWSFWGVASSDEWKSRLLKFLNFIVREDFSEGFVTLEEASLMVKVHQELVRAIADL